MYKILVTLYQQTKHARFVEKEIEYPFVPVPGCFFEYEQRWPVAAIQNVNETTRGLKVYMMRTGIWVRGTSTQFSEEGLISLENLGWTVHRNE